MTWKHWLQTIIAAMVMLLCLLLGRIVWPVLQAMAPILAWTILIAVEIIVISLAIGVPAAIVIGLRGHHRTAEAKMIEARKLHVTERGYIQGYVSSSPKERILVPQISAYSVEVPGNVHIEEDHSNSASAANELAREKFEWQKQIDALKYRQIEAPRVALPDAPPFRQVMPYIQPKERVVNGKVEDASEVVLACDDKGVVIGTVLDWLSTLVVGKPGNGKSTALYFFIAQLMLLASKFQVLDPHGTLISLKEMLPYINKTDNCINAAPVIEAELEARMDRYEANDGQCFDPHYMLIVDELPVIADREEQRLSAMDRKAKAQFRSLIDVIRRVVCEGRKYKMYCMVVGQSIPASILPTIARDNMSTRYVFYCSDAHARMAGVDKEAIDLYLPHLRGAVGKCIVAPARMETFVGAIPLTEVDDLRYVIESTGYVRDGYDCDAETERNTDGDMISVLSERDESVSGNVSVFPRKPVFAEEKGFARNGNEETARPAGVTDLQLAQIEGMYKANWPLREIAERVHLTGGSYWKIQAALKHLGLAQRQEA